MSLLVNQVPQRRRSRGGPRAHRQGRQAISERECSGSRLRAQRYQVPAGSAQANALRAGQPALRRQSVRRATGDAARARHRRQRSIGSGFFNRMSRWFRSRCLIGLDKWEPSDRRCHVPCSSSPLPDRGGMWPDNTFATTVDRALVAMAWNFCYRTRGWRYGRQNGCRTRNVKTGRKNEKLSKKTAQTTDKRKWLYASSRLSVIATQDWVISAKA